MEGENRYAARILQVVQKTLEADIPRIVPAVTQNHFSLMNAVLGYLSQTNIPVVQVNSLCRRVECREREALRPFAGDGADRLDQDRAKGK